MRHSKNFRVFISDKYSEKLIKLRTTQDRAMYTENNYGGPICLLHFSHVPHVALSTVPCLNLNHSSLFYFMSKCKVFKALSNVADVRVPFLKFCYYWRLQYVCCPQGMGDVTQQASFHRLSCNDIHWCTCMKHLGGSFNEERRWKAR